MIYLKKHFRLVICLVACFISVLYMTEASASPDGRTVKVGVYPLERFHAVDDAGKFSGYDIDYLHRIAQYTGWQYEYVEAPSWAEAINMLRDGRIDLLSPSQITTARLNEFGFSTFPIGKVYAAILTNTDNKTVYEDYAAFEKMTFGIEQGNTYTGIFNKYASTHNFTPHIVFYNNHNDLVQALNNGEVDAIVANVMRAEDDMRLLGKAGTALYYYMYRKGDIQLGAELDFALDQIEIATPRFQADLVSDYFPIYNEDPFTKAELDYAMQLPSIRIACNTDNRPYSYIDEETGEITGIAVEFLQQAIATVGREVAFVPTPAVIDRNFMETNNIKLVLKSSNRINSKNVQGIMYTNDFLNSREVVICRSDVYYTPSSSMTMAYAATGDNSEVALAKLFPGFTFVECDTVEAAFEAVQTGKVECCLVNQYAADWYGSMPRYENLITVPDAGADESFCLMAFVDENGFNTDDAKFRSILNKAFKQLTDAQIQQIVIKYTTAMPYKLTFSDFCLKYNWQIITFCVSFVIVLLTVATAFSNRQRILIKMRQKNEQLADAVQQAERANDSKSQFLSRMSHEIRTPINAIVGLTNIAKKYHNDPEQIDEYLSKIEISSHLLLNIINDVLDMSAIESNKLKIANVEFDLKEVLEQISTVYYSQCRLKGIDFDMRANITNEILVGDALRLKQILINIVSNAYKFTTKGSITVNVSQTISRGNEGFFCFEITDTGEGMTKEMQERLFNPFEQENALTAQIHGGSGLGMAITKNLVDMMHGAISVTSVKGQGTSFRVDLPFDFGNERNASAPERIKQVHALIVDDDSQAREYAAIVFDRIGIQYDTADSGEQALEKLISAHDKGSGYDICFVDWKMPGMDGVKLTSKIREKFDEDTIVIIVSAYDLSEVSDVAVDAGANMFLPKPLFQSSVYNLLLQLCGAQRQVEEIKVEDYDFTGHRVLLAEDNALNTEIAVELLSMVNMQADCAENGQIAVDMFKNSAPGTYDAILMDIQMPIMDGYAATQTIRSLERADAATIPILAMTANAFSEDVSKSLASGMDGHISKPIDTELLYSELQKAIESGENK